MQRGWGMLAAPRTSSGRDDSKNSAVRWNAPCCLRRRVPCPARYRGSHRTIGAGAAGRCGRCQAVPASGHGLQGLPDLVFSGSQFRGTVPT
mgnify:CR=1 FL=1